MKINNLSIKNFCDVALYERIWLTQLRLRQGEMFGEVRHKRFCPSHSSYLISTLIHSETE